MASMQCYESCEKKCVENSYGHNPSNIGGYPAGHAMGSNKPSGHLYGHSNGSHGHYGTDSSNGYSHGGQAYYPGSQTMGAKPGMSHSSYGGHGHMTDHTMAAKPGMTSSYGYGQSTYGSTMTDHTMAAKPGMNGYGQSTFGSTMAGSGYGNHHGYGHGHHGAGQPYTTSSHGLSGGGMACYGKTERKMKDKSHCKKDKSHSKKKNNGCNSDYSSGSDSD